MRHIDSAANELACTLRGKNRDYAPTTEFSNFEEAAKLAGVEVMQSILLQIGIKYSRLMSLAGGDGKPNFESVRDTLMDLAGYSVIGAAKLDQEQSENPDVPVRLAPSWVVPLQDDE